MVEETVFSRIAWQAIEIERFLENEAVILAHQVGLEALPIAWRLTIAATEPVLRVLNKALGP
ncbi:MAG: hypothetical protein ACOYMW_12305 [Candidatus Competibacteraceae bacterium]